ncbi:MAG: transcriptional repressor LexA [Gammaproteobacteria bacterium]|nr:transcriptional repressor LexA [Gammaproteobacteria bacterium]
MLTAKQLLVLENIQLYINQNGRQPTLTEIGARLGIGESGIHKHIRKLISLGYLNESEGKAAYQPIDEPERQGTLPLVGVIAAGQPIEAIPDRQSIDLVTSFCGPEHYALKVSGDSMIEAGILDGDYVVIRKQTIAKTGEIIVALISHVEATLKFYHPRDTGVVELRPANCEMESMFYPATEVEIQGVMIGSFRHTTLH